SKTGHGQRVRPSIKGDRFTEHPHSANEKGSMTVTDPPAVDHADVDRSAVDHSAVDHTVATTRTEHDLLGDLEVPQAAYYGVHTVRAAENFPITGITLKMYPLFIT